MRGELQITRSVVSSTLLPWEKKNEHKLLYVHALQPEWTSNPAVHNPEREGCCDTPPHLTAKKTNAPRTVDRTPRDQGACSWEGAVSEAYWPPFDEMVLILFLICFPFHFFNFALALAPSNPRASCTESDGPHTPSRSALDVCILDTRLTFLLLLFLL